MTAEEAFAEAMAELDEVHGIDALGQPVKKLRILPAEEPPKERGRIGLGHIITASWLIFWAGLRFITFLAGRYL